MYAVLQNYLLKDYLSKYVSKLQESEYGYDLYDVLESSGYIDKHLIWMLL